MQHGQNSTSQPNPPTILLMPGIFNESLQMLTDAHEYFLLFASSDQQAMPPELRTVYVCEMSRITLRLSSVMAWLLVRRAVNNGKISEQEALRYPLAFPDTCLLDLGRMDHILPNYVGQLMGDSLELYKRILRLDGQYRTCH